VVIIVNLQDNKYMKNKLFILCLAVILLTGYLTLAINSSTPKSLSRTEIDIAVNQAKYFYKIKKESGADLSLGPCLSDALMPNWVVDLVHEPRIPLDDLPENQCPASREGKSLHFVELDLEGNLIRAE